MTSSIPFTRRAVPRVSALALSAALAAACGHAGPPSVAPAPQPSSLRPEDSRLVALDVRDTTAVFRLLMRAANDTVEHERSRVQRGERDLGDGTMLLTSEWAPPYTSNDTAVVRRRGLRPLREHLAFNKVTRTYRYDGRHITGTIRSADSAARPFDRTFPEAPFAFSESELLVRSMPLRPGFRAVVPLFSEIDEAIEHDTITVLGPDSATAGVWRVRFADPVLIMVYGVSVPTRRILGTDIVQRHSGMHMRYVPLGPS